MSHSHTSPKNYGKSAPHLSPGLTHLFQERRIGDHSDQGGARLGPQRPQEAQVHRDQARSGALVRRGRNRRGAVPFLPRPPLGLRPGHGDHRRGGVPSRGGPLPVQAPLEGLRRREGHPDAHNRGGGDRRRRLRRHLRHRQEHHVLERLAHLSDPPRPHLGAWRARFRLALGNHLQLRPREARPLHGAAPHPPAPHRRDDFRVRERTDRLRGRRPPRLRRRCFRLALLLVPARLGDRGQPRRHSFRDLLDDLRAHPLQHHRGANQTGRTGRPDRLDRPGDSDRRRDHPNRGHGPVGDRLQAEPQGKNLRVAGVDVEGYSAGRCQHLPKRSFVKEIVPGRSGSDHAGGGDRQHQGTRLRRENPDDLRALHHPDGSNRGDFDHVGRTAPAHQDQISRST